MKKSKVEDFYPETRLVTAGREYAEHGFVNPAVYRASTVLFRDSASLMTEASQPYTYGREGTPTSRAVESAICELEQGAGTRVCSSGLAAISVSLLAFLKAGDHLLLTDSAYYPARRLADGLLSRMGIETTFYEPTMGGSIAQHVKSNTRVIYAESPGSQTMEVQDIPALAEIARKANATLIVDNTWGAGHYLKPLKLGAHVSLQAATKYLVGHSDAMLGCVTCDQDHWPIFNQTFKDMGQFAGPDDMYLALRGIRTLDVRMERQMKNALDVADWLRGREEVAEVLYPALPNAPGHTIWKRDFTGAASLFSIILKTQDEKALAAMLDEMQLFGLGYSWGGYESLMIPFKPIRTAKAWADKGLCLRLHIGLENPHDLKADLEAGFARLKAASA